jgi:peptide/nickel transport system permease protein
MRNCLLDELRKQYVVTARAKGVSESALLFRYPVRVAINPIISTLAWVFPRIFSGGAITAVVLGIPTMGPLLLHALLSQDMYLAGASVMILGSLTFLGAFLSDLLLVAADPRIRLS